MRAIGLILALTAFAASGEELVDLVIHDARSIPEPLVPGLADPARGAEIGARECAACHEDLAGAGARLTAGELRLIIAEPRVLWPETEMPSYYAPGLYGEAPDEMVGRTILSAAEIEDVVAWLSGL